MTDYTDHLFSYIPSDRISRLSCGHVIPKKNLIVWPVSRGPNGQTFDFTFEHRKSSSMVGCFSRFYRLGVLLLIDLD